MITRIQLRRDTAANWEANDPVLALAEMGIDTTSGNFKIGNGTDQWTQLNYFSTEVEDVISKAQLDAALAAIDGVGLTWNTETEKLDIDNPFDPNGNYVNLRAQATTAGDVGLGNVNNTADANKFVAGAIETNNSNNLQFWTGTQAQYDNLTPNANTFYIIEED